MKTILFKLFILLITAFHFNVFSPGQVISHEIDGTDFLKKTDNLILRQAVICEDIRDRKPYNQGVVFSSDLGSISCFTDFFQIGEKTFIYHKYYFNDKFSAKVKLTLNPPHWATFSKIQLRETDVGPWRVDITDLDGNILYTLRFSITD